MDNRYIRNNEDSILDVRHLMLSFVAHWKSLIVFLVIGGLLGCAFSYYQQQCSKKKDSDELATMAEELEIKADVLGNMELAIEYRTLYESQKKYNEESILMNIDPNQCYSGRSVYYISASSDVDYVIEKLQGCMSSKEMLQSMCRVAGIDETEYQYIGEVLTFSVKTPEDSLADALLQNSALEKIKGKNRIITIGVDYTEEVGCSELLNVFQEVYDAMVDEISKEVSDVHVEKIRESVKLSTNNGYRNTQKANIDQLNTLYAAYTKIEDSFSEDEKNYYYEAYFHEDKEINSSISLKMVVIFAFIAGILWGSWWLIRYFMDERVKTCQEFLDNYQIPIIGAMGNAAKGRLEIQKRKLNQKVCGAPLSEKHLANCVESLTKKQVCFVALGSSSDARKRIDALAQSCADAFVIDSLEKDSISFGELGKCSIIYCVSDEEVKKSVLTRELDLCNLHELSVIGAIFVF